MTLIPFPQGRKARNPRAYPAIAFQDVVAHVCQLCREENGDPASIEAWLNKARSLGWIVDLPMQPGDITGWVYGPTSVTAAIGIPEGWPGSLANFRWVLMTAHQMLLDQAKTGGKA